MAANSVDVRVLLFAADVGVRRVSQQVHQEGAHQWLDTRHLCALHQWVRVFPYMILIHCEKIIKQCHHYFLTLFPNTFTNYLGSMHSSTFRLHYFLKIIIKNLLIPNSSLVAYL